MSIAIKHTVNLLGSSRNGTDWFTWWFSLCCWPGSVFWFGDRWPRQLSVKTGLLQPSDRKVLAHSGFQETNYKVYSGSSLK